MDVPPTSSLIILNYNMMSRFLLLLDLYGGILMGYNLQILFCILIQNNPDSYRGLAVFRSISYRRTSLLIMFSLLVLQLNAQPFSVGVLSGYGQTHYQLEDRTAAGYLPVSIFTNYQINDFLIGGLDFSFNLNLFPQQ